ncbi:MAG: type II toxin-antitoxin system RelE family toxin [Candidatus Woesearchaeota archaeon]
MVYEVVLTDKSKKQLRKLELNQRERVISVLERIRIRPYSHIKKLVGNPYFRVRVGDLRIIIDIKDEKLIILVLEIGNRRNIQEK